MDKKTFSVILPSNSNPTIFPNNSPSEFSVDLTNPVYLNGKYEVALSEVTYYNDIALLKNNYIEISETKYVDECFRASGNGFYNKWDYKPIKLAKFKPRSYSSAEAETIVKNKVEKWKAYKEMRATQTNILTLFNPFKNLFTIKLKGQSGITIAPSDSVKRENKKLLLTLSKKLSEQLGYGRRIFSSRESYSGRGLSYGIDVEDWNAVLIPLYALKKREYVIKRTGEKIEDINKLVKKLNEVFGPDVLTAQYSEDTSILTFNKFSPLTHDNWNVFEINLPFSMIFDKIYGAPYLVYPDDPLLVQLTKERFVKNQDVDSEWTIIVYNNDVDLQNVKQETKLIRRVNYHVNPLKSPADLVTKLNEFPEEISGNDEYSFSYNPLEKKLKVTVGDGYQIKFDKSLRSILGFTKSEILKSGVFTADSAPSLEPEINNLYIYTNIVEYTRVGNIEAPLLRTLPLSSTHKQIINREFINRIFLPVNRNIINRINVSIHDDAGELVHFNGGITVLTLIFRPCQE